jgi:hypothetical protein
MRCPDGAVQSGYGVKRQFTKLMLRASGAGFGREVVGQLPFSDAPTYLLST